MSALTIQTDTLPMTSIQTEIERCVASRDWVKTATVAELPGYEALLINTRYRPDGVELSYYVRHDGADGIGSALSILEDSLPNPSNPTAETIDRVLAELLAVPDIENVRVEPLGPNAATARLSAPLLGSIDFEITTRTSVKAVLSGMVDEARRRFARRRMSVMSVVGIATVARDADDAAMLVETALNGRDVLSTHRGITTVTTPSSDVVMTAVTHDNLVMDQDGMRLKELPDTVATAITGRGSRGRELSGLVDHPVMRLLKVGTARWTDEAVVIVPGAYRGRRMSLPLDRAAAIALAIRIMADI